MRHVPEPTELLLIGCSIELIWTPKPKSKTSTPKTQLADILTNGNFTRDEWNHLLNLFTTIHFSSTACTAAVAKRAQQGSGEGRVTAKSRPMMSLTARMLSIESSSTSSNLGMTSYGYQDPGKSVASDDRSGKLENSSPSGYSKEDYCQSCLLKSGKVELHSTIDRGNLRKILGIYCKKLRFIVKNLFSAGMRILQGTERRFTIERVKPETVSLPEEANS